MRSMPQAQDKRKVKFRFHCASMTNDCARPTASSTPLYPFPIVSGEGGGGGGSSVWAGGLLSRCQCWLQDD